MEAELAAAAADPERTATLVRRIRNLRRSKVPGSQAACPWWPEAWSLWRLDAELHREVALKQILDLHADDLG